MTVTDLQQFKLERQKKQLGGTLVDYYCTFTIQYDEDGSNILKNFMVQGIGSDPTPSQKRWLASVFENAAISAHEAANEDEGEDLSTDAVLAVIQFWQGGNVHASILPNLDHPPSEKQKQWFARRLLDAWRLYTGDPDGQLPQEIREDVGPSGLSTDDRDSGDGGSGDW